MKHADKINHLCVVARICRGQSKHSLDVLDQYIVLRKANESSKAYALLSSFALSAGITPLSPYLSLFELDAIAFTLAHMHKDDCGQDLNELLLRYPYDGQIRIVVCPRCNTEHSIQMPLLD